ncbi:MAG: DNA-directed RNA polymerase subunit alpha [Rhabdochlamydiaceae bacterium]
MAIRYGKFEVPAKIKVDDSMKKEGITRFIAEPFERGFGHTVGNFLRRILLSSLESPAIVSVRIEGVSHEYMAMEGIIEDMTHIVLNLKNALLRKLPSDEEPGSRESRLLTKNIEITPDMLEKNGGYYKVCLKDLIDNHIYEIVNPEMTIFTVTKPMTKRVDLRIEIGRGYVPSERHEIKDRMVDEIVVDTSFSPVRLVNYFVENTRVGQDTDYDRLILDICTDSRVNAEEAVSFAVQIGMMHLQVFEKLQFHQINFDQDDAHTDSDRDAIMSKLALKINEIELSVRSTNCLFGANIETIGELVVMPESEMLKFRNFGKKSLNEIKAKLQEMNLSLGMDLSGLGIDRDNVKEMVSEFLNEKAGEEA